MSGLFMPAHPEPVEGRAGERQSWMGEHQPSPSRTRGPITRRGGGDGLRLSLPPYRGTGQALSTAERAAMTVGGGLIRRPCESRGLAPGGGGGMDCGLRRNDGGGRPHPSPLRKQESITRRGERGWIAAEPAPVSWYGAGSEHSRTGRNDGGGGRPPARNAAQARRRSSGCPLSRAWVVAGAGGRQASSPVCGGRLRWGPQCGRRLGSPPSMLRQAQHEREYRVRSPPAFAGGRV